MEDPIDRIITDNDTNLSPLMESIINKIVDEGKKRKYRDRLMKDMIVPLLEDINNKYYPYIMTLTVLLCLIIILLILLLVTNVRNNNTIGIPK